MLVTKRDGSKKELDLNKIHGVFIFSIRSESFYNLEKNID